MVAVSSRQNFWFVIFFIAMIVGGTCCIGYWQTYDRNCGGTFKVWTWNKMPPQFECRQF